MVLVFLDSAVIIRCSVVIGGWRMTLREPIDGTRATLGKIENAGPMLL